MVEMLRLGYSENLPFDQLAWGYITTAAQITRLLPLLTANYDLSNNMLYQAQRRGEHFLRLYFQAQSLDGIRQLQPIDGAHGLLRQEWHQPDCRITDVGLLCPYQSSLTQWQKHLDNRATLPVSVRLPWASG